jgi:hypothetical protein
LFKKKPPASAKAACRRVKFESLSLLFLFRGKCGLGGLCLGGTLLEFVHAPGGVHELLLAGIEGMADVADADNDHGLGGAGLDHVATGAADFRVHIFRMDVRLHKKGLENSMNLPDDKTEMIGIHAPAIHCRSSATTSLEVKMRCSAFWWLYALKNFGGSQPNRQIVFGPQIAFDHFHFPPEVKKLNLHEACPMV